MRRILIVGTGSGVGKGLLERLGRQEDLETIAVSRSRPVEPVSQFIPYDVLSESNPPPLDGSLNGLVYCPGSILLKPFGSLGLNDFRADMEVNFFGAVKLIRHYLPALKGSGNASVVLFSSVAAGNGMAYHSSIAAAKAAVEGLTRSLAAELAPGVRVNAIAPSIVGTQLASKLINPEMKVKVAADRHPMKRIGTVSDIVSATCYLLSEDSSWMTGQVLHCDGGLSAIR